MVDGHGGNPGKIHTKWSPERVNDGMLQGSAQYKDKSLSCMLKYNTILLRAGSGKKCQYGILSFLFDSFPFPRLPFVLLPRPKGPSLNPEIEYGEHCELPQWVWAEPGW